MRQLREEITRLKVLLAGHGIACGQSVGFTGLFPKNYLIDSRGTPVLQAKTKISIVLGEYECL